MEHLQLSTFFNEIDANKYGDLFVQLTQLQCLFHSADPNLDLIGVEWAKFEDRIDSLLTDFDNFRENGSARSPIFEYWDKFINCIAPILRNLTRSFREGNWNLHLSAVRRAIPLCFAFDRIMKYQL